MGDEPRYEDLIATLEEAVARLESERLGLEEALAVFEGGHRLLRQAQERLAGLEGRMERLLTDGTKEPLGDASEG